MVSARNILIVEDDQIDSVFFEHVLLKDGYDVKSVGNAKEALDILPLKNFGLVLVDLKMSKMDGISLLELIKRYYPLVEVIIITAHASVDTAVEAMRRGAFSYFIKGDPVEKLLNDVKKAFIVNPISYGDSFSDDIDVTPYKLRTRGVSLSRALKTGKVLGDAGVNTLIVGPKGAGRKAFAQHMHASGRNKHNSFLEADASVFDTCFNAADFDHTPLDLLLSIQQNSGTIYFENIHLVDPVKINEFIDYMEKNSPSPVSGAAGMIISSCTPQGRWDLKGRIGAEKYFNYWSFQVEIPGLEDRREDLPVLVEEVFNRTKARFDCKVERVDPNLLERISKLSFVHQFDGLEKLIERMMAAAESSTLRPSLLDKIEISDIIYPRNSLINPGEPESLKEARKRAETDYIRLILERTGGNKTRAADALGISPRQLYNTMKKYGLD